jgi:hypothetical protein
VKFDLEVFCGFIISHRTQNTGLDGQSFHAEITTFLQEC